MQKYWIARNARLMLARNATVLTYRNLKLALESYKELSDVNIFSSFAKRISVNVTKKIITN